MLIPENNLAIVNNYLLKEELFSSKQKRSLLFRSTIIGTFLSKWIGLMPKTRVKDGFEGLEQRFSKLKSLDQAEIIVPQSYERVETIARAAESDLSTIERDDILMVFDSRQYSSLLEKNMLSDIADHRVNRFGLESALVIGEKVASLLDHLYQKCEFVHGNIAPENIFITAISQNDLKIKIDGAIFPRSSLNYTSGENLEHSVDFDYRQISEKRYLDRQGLAATIIHITNFIDRIHSISELREMKTSSFKDSFSVFSLKQSQILQEAMKDGNHMSCVELIGALKNSRSAPSKTSGSAKPSFLKRLFNNQG